MGAPWPYTNDEADHGITHADGEVTATDIVSTFPGVDGGDGNPREVVIRKPLP